MTFISSCNMSEYDKRSERKRQQSRMEAAEDTTFRTMADGMADSDKPRHHLGSTNVITYRIHRPTRGGTQ